FWLVQALLPALRRAATADDPARIINIGSIAAIHVAQSPNYSYAGSKAALHQLTRVLARELGPQHVTVNAVAPGVFPSQMMAATLDAVGDTIAAAAPLRRLGRDDDMAGIAVFLASRAGSYLTGTVIPVDGGIATIASGKAAGLLECDVTTVRDTVHRLKTGGLATPAKCTRNSLRHNINCPGPSRIAPVRDSGSRPAAQRPRATMTASPDRPCEHDLR
ncbi:SDR family oxidoreductase, partial [Streptomyces sp. NPDC048342]|uniref:SDR family oxidoreductase n=2 Tax=unclassified Streptomyces TaxID=2593676 RepID=UPI003445868B